MKYSKFIKQERACPFCKPKDRVFASNGSSYLTYAIAPYTKYHLLVIPKRHDMVFTEITPKEWKDLYAMLAVGAGVLRRKGITEYTILLRNGNALGFGTGRSVEHLHLHIVPKHRIGDLERKGVERRVMSPKAIVKLTDEITGMLKKK